MTPGPEPRTLEIPYRWAGAEGKVQVEVRPNEEPSALGCAEFARGFPYCTATVDPPAIGYGHILGWVQLVEHGDHEPGFQIDPFTPLGETSHPFAFFGFAPILFDAPHGDEFEDWDFRAHSFLCGLGGDLYQDDREIQAILGFAWGFSKRGGKVEFLGPDLLCARDWDGHLGYLHRTFTNWTFAPGFRPSPP